MMIVNPDKFQAIIIDRNIQQNNPTSIKINDININSESSVRLLGLEIDSKLNIHKHTTQLCKTNASQLNALCRLKLFLNTNQRKNQVNNFIYSNYNYCPLIWHFCSKTLMNKRFSIMINGSTETKNDGFRSFQSLNDLHPSFMKQLFNKKIYINRRKNDLIIHTQNTAMFGSNSLRCLGPHVWNTLPENIKEIISFEKFKESLNNWYEPSCKCSLCYYQN